jgi:tRNA 2-thiouridine synthesizing protein A
MYIFKGVGLVIENHNILDATGLRCPMPLLKLKQALNKLDSGDVIKIITTDSGSVKDFQSYINLTSHTLLELKQVSSQYLFWIKKG